MLYKIIIILLLSLSVQGADNKLDDLFDKKGEIFTTSSEKLAKSAMYFKFFKWINSDKSKAIYTDVAQEESIFFLDEKIVEVILEFKNDKFFKTEISLFNKGDLKENISSDEFSKKVDYLENKISNWQSVKAEDLKEQFLLGNKINRKIWNNKPYLTILTWSSSGNSKRTFVGEYIKLSIAAYQDNFDEKSLECEMKTQKSLKKLISKTDDGGIFIDNIPMVDQGRKGYCVAAASARVIQYYGLTNVDQHLIAQLCESSTTGTKRSIFAKNLKRLGFKFGVRFKEYYLMESRDFIKMLDKHNKFIKKGDRKIEYASKVAFYPFEQILSNIQKSIVTFKEYKLKKEKGDYNRKFLRNIRDSIDDGIPIIWSVSLGLIEEGKLPQSFGGHMRLIIGYNDKTKEVYYSDSWGAKHEFKKMDYGDAWVMTKGIFAFIPRK